MKHVPKPLTDENGLFSGTVASKKTCESLCEYLGGVTLLAFSGGKDSLACWLYLLDCGFDTIRPFHCSAIPGIQYVDKGLTYYEQWFETSIHRYLQGENQYNLANRIYQPFQDLELLDALDFWDYTIDNVADLHGEALGMAEDTVWLAKGICMFDNVNRITQMNRCLGQEDDKQIFYPIWDWKPTQVTEYISRFDISLSLDYLLDKTSLEGLPLVGTLLKMKELFPQDYERVKLFFPLIEAKLARHQFRLLHAAKRSGDPMLNKKKLGRPGG